MEGTIGPMPDADETFAEKLEGQGARALRLVGLVLVVQPISGFLMLLFASASYAEASRPPFAIGLGAARVVLPLLAALGFGLFLFARQPRAGRRAPWIVAVVLAAATVLLAWAESPHRANGGPSIMPFVVLIGVTLVPFRPRSAVLVTLGVSGLFIGAIANLPMSTDVSQEERLGIVQGTLPSLMALVVTVMVVSSAVHRGRLQGIRDQIERDALSEKNRTQAEALSRANRELLAAQNELVRRRHLSVLANLVAGVAHELNNPTGALRSALDVLKRAHQVISGELEHPTNKTARALGALRNAEASAFEAAGRIADVVRSLRLFARLDEADEQDVFVADCVEAAIALLKPELDGLLLDRDYVPTSRVRCRPALLNEVFFELIGNAARAVGDRGKITVRIRNHPDTVRVSVVDDGPGIPPALRERIFEPGFSGEGRRVGVGLGLSTVLRIVDEHNGTLKVESSSLGGAELTVSLPTSQRGGATQPEFAPPSIDRQPLDPVDRTVHYR